ncbi:MAG: hypothetical protein O3C65_13320 [Proteobacteria bacterium]|nr:hypothetical protein [Pseudomonadota bacterium]MDA1059657.1 hypothetical protein [Pseudomonadota bacterium]
MRVRLGLPIIGALVIVGLVAACTRTPPLPCPPVSILGDAEDITLFAADRGEDLTDIAYRASIDQIGRNCDYARAGDSVTSTISVRLVATRGPAAQVDEGSFVFFVAVVDKEQNILARERFESAFSFQPNQRQAAAIEEIEQIIPIKSGLRGLDYEVLVGFELTPAQLEFNRQERQRRTGQPRVTGR